MHRALAVPPHIIRSSLHGSSTHYRFTRASLSRCPCPCRSFARAIAILLEISNVSERSRISDIFIVRDWEHGQSLTIIRRIFLADVLDGTANFILALF